MVVRLPLVQESAYASQHMVVTLPLVHESDYPTQPMVVRLPLVQESDAIPVVKPAYPTHLHVSGSGVVGEHLQDVDDAPAPRI